MKTRDPFPALRLLLEVLRDVGAGEAVSFQPLAGVIRGAIAWQSGTESTEAGAQRITRRGTVTIYHYPGLSAADKLRIYGTSRVWEIESVITPDEVPHLMELTVVERA